MKKRKKKIDVLFALEGSRYEGKEKKKKDNFRLNITHN